MPQRDWEESSEEMSVGGKVLCPWFKSTSVRGRLPVLAVLGVGRLLLLYDFSTGTCTCTPSL